LIGIENPFQFVRIMPRYCLEKALSTKDTKSTELKTRKLN